METKESSITALGLLVLRVGIGGLMIVHAIPKIQDFEKIAGAFPDPIGLGSKMSLILAIGAEAGCSALLIAGLLTRLAAIPLTFTMLVAAFKVHAEHAWDVKEKAVLYLLVYVVLILTGPGKFSIDGLFRGKKTKA